MTRPGYVMVRTDLRYVIELPDGRYFIADSTGELCLISLTKKKGMRTFYKDKTLGPKLEAKYEPEIIYTEKGIRKEEKYGHVEWSVNDPNTGNKILVLKRSNDPDGAEEYAKFFSRLYLIFPVEDIEKESTFMEESLFLINKLVGVYRTRTGLVNVPYPVSRNHLSGYMTFISEKNDEDYELTLKGQLVRERALVPKMGEVVYNHLEVGLIKTPTKKAVDEVKEMLVQDVSVDLASSFLLNAKEHWIYHKNYEVSVILAQTGFEIFISDVLRDLLKSDKGLSDERITALYRDPKKLLYFRRKLSRLDAILQKYKKGKFKGTSQHKTWNEKAYQLRNEIVHEGKNGIKEEDAKEAWNAVINARKYLWNNLKELHTLGKPKN